jgi:CRISPR/Cas system-associated endoribonuclease Cas2
MDNIKTLSRMRAHLTKLKKELDKLIEAYEDDTSVFALKEKIELTKNRIEEMKDAIRFVKN